MSKFDKTTYVIHFTGSDKPDLTIHGIRDLARFASNDLYTVTGLKGRALSSVELDEWERLTDLLFGTDETPILPKGNA